MPPAMADPGQHNGVSANSTDNDVTKASALIQKGPASWRFFLR